ncbi:DUF2845 domain-containing protein [Dyella humicola]|uniref:DUF2845 domain-containing protein n=1 Tax=Dyella humicola TaxID=2992126 RepID=UPI0022532B81|nr:DUF2845 domain-containing protein [Dyella humicola]
MRTWFVDKEVAMRRYGLSALLLVAFAAHAGSSTLRVGNQVLTVGDSASRVVELLGKSSYKSHKKTGTRSGNARGAKHSGRRKTSSARETGGEQWQYRRGDRVTTVLLADGKVVGFEDSGR